MSEREEELPVGIKTKVYLTNAEGTEFMGIGVVWLLQKIDAYGSIKRAAEEMSLSYAKAHRMVTEAERGLGTKLIHRRRGGESRRGAELTKEARFFIHAYEELQRSIKKDAAKRFEAFLDKTGARFGLAGIEKTKGAEAST